MSWYPLTTPTGAVGVRTPEEPSASLGRTMPDQEFFLLACQVMDADGAVSLGRDMEWKYSTSRYGWIILLPRW